MNEPKKPTIAELEKILSEPAYTAIIQPDGQAFGVPNKDLPFIEQLQQRIRDLEAQLAEALRSKVHLQVELDRFATDNAEYRFKMDLRLAEAWAEVVRLREGLRSALDFINDWKVEDDARTDFDDWFGKLATLLEGK